MTTAAKTARHFTPGTFVFHREYGVGVVRVGSDGSHYPRFPRTTGTRHTRVIAAVDRPR